MSRKGEYFVMSTATLPFRLPGVNYFGMGALKYLKDEIKESNVYSVFIISDKNLDQIGLVDQVFEEIKAVDVSVVKFLDVEQEPSIENVDRAVDAYKNSDCDMIVAVGGGSVIDVAKGVSVLATNGGSILDYAGEELIPKSGVPKALIPTTAGTGAEITKNAIFTDKQQKLKKGVISKYLLPEIAIVDPELTLTVPPSLTAATGMDALTHAIESYTAAKASIHTDIYALKAIELIGRSLRAAVANGQNIDAREQMAFASVFAGISLANAGVGGVHAVAYPLGGQFNISHGVANAVSLPYVLEFNVQADLEKFKNIAWALGIPLEGRSLVEQAELSIEGVKKLSRDVGIPQNLTQLGVKKVNVEGLADAAFGVTRLLNNNPRKMEKEDVLNILNRAL